MPVPIVWTPDEFTEASTPETIIKRGRDSHLKLVDFALKDFDKVKNTVMHNEKYARCATTGSG